MSHLDSAREQQRRKASIKPRIEMNNQDIVIRLDAQFISTMVDDLLKGFGIDREDVTDILRIVNRQRRR